MKVDINQAALWPGKYPPLVTSTLVNNFDCCCCCVSLQPIAPNPAIPESQAIYEEHIKVDIFTYLQNKLLLQNWWLSQ